MTGAVLVTGFPALRARFILPRAAEVQPLARVIALTHPSRREEAEALVEAYPAALRARVELVIGDAAAMDFGLAGPEYLALAERIVSVHAAYSITDASAADPVAERVNIGAARELIELCRAHPRRCSVVFYSSVLVSGNRAGRVSEGDLEAGQAFRAPAERTLAVAERMLRRSGLPVAVLRSGHLLGDTESGMIEHPSGPYPLMILIASAPDDRPLPLFLSVDSPLPLTPVDYLAAFGANVERAGAFQRTFHVLGEEGMRLRRFLELCAEQCGKRLEVSFNPGVLTRALLGNPAARWLPQNARGILEVLTTAADYDTAGAQELLAAGAPACPPLSSYLPRLIDHVRARIHDESFASGRRQEPAYLVA